MSESNVLDASYRPDTRPDLPRNRHSKKRRHTTGQSTADISDTENDDPESSYKGGLTTYARVQMVIRNLQDHHRWTLKDFIRFYITAESDEVYGRSKSLRLKRLQEALAQEEVHPLLFAHSGDLYEPTMPLLVDKLRAEVQRLCNPDIGLGVFDHNMPIHNINIKAFSQHIYTIVPFLYSILLQLITRQDSKKMTVKHNDYVFLLCSIISF